MRFIFSFLLLTTFYSFSQVGGENIYQFLNITTSAKQVALGGEIISIDNDINQPLWNPSTINNNLDRKLSLNYANYLADVNIGSLSYATSLLNNFGVFYGNISYVNYGKFFGADEFGFETGTFSANDIAITLGYSYNLANSFITFGSNFKFITSNIENFSSNGVAFDLAILYNNPNKPFLITFVIRNLGVQLKSYNGVKENLPLTISLGSSYKLKYVPLRWYLTINNLQQWEIAVPNPSNQITDLEGNTKEENITLFDNIFRRLVFGAELFSEKAINLRFGYNFMRASELRLQNVRTFSGFSLGFGIKLNKIKFNYAFSNYHSATNTSTFSLEMNLFDN